MIHYNTNYPAPAQVKEVEIVPRKLFVGGLSYDTTDNSLAAYFSQFGQIASATVLRDPVNSHSRGFGFVTFADDFGASRVLAQSRNHIVDGRKVEAKLAFPKTKRSRQLTSPIPDQMRYASGYSNNLQPINMGMAPDGFNMPMGVTYEQPVYHSQLPELYNTNIHPGVNAQNINYNSKREYEDINFHQNSLSASLASQNFHQDSFEARTPRASVIETSSFPRHGQSLRRKTLSHIHLQSELIHDSASNDEGQPGKLYVPTTEFESLNLHMSTSKSTILISGIADNTPAEELNKFCTTFGKVASATMDPQGFGKVVFEHSGSVDKVMSYQRINGNLFFDGKEITVTRDTAIHKSSDKRWVEKPFVRSNTFQTEREFFGGNDSDDGKDPSISLMRAMSVTQNMMNNTSTKMEFPKFNHKHSILRDSKSRSLSVIASLNKDSSLVAHNMNISNRRSSSFAETALDLDYENNTNGQL